MGEVCLNGGRIDLLDSGPSQMTKFRSFIGKKGKIYFHNNTN